MKLARLLLMVVLALGVVVTLVTAPSAARNQPAEPPGKEDCRPGFGYGDQNHCHTGPPGHTPYGSRQP